ncbi:MAG: hypothetical protein AAFV19_09070 [Pseudomonadota bacterium]
MIRRIVALGVLVVAVALVWIFLFAPPERLEARFAHQDCRRVAVTDSRTGQPVIGIEDLAQVPGGGRIVFSAHDRVDPALPDGGLYETSLFELNAGGAITVSNLVDLSERTAPFRPHGIALSPGGDRLAVINRTGPAEARIEIGAHGPRTWVLETRLKGDKLCRANDLSFSGAGPDSLTITIDRGACQPSIADYMPGARTGRVVQYAGQALTDVRSNLTFPNGIEGDWIAETRGHRLIATDGREVLLPGGPDNLNRAEDGTVIAALHPKLAQLGLYLNDWSGSAPSRLARINTETGRVEILFDDPAGALFAAATSGVLIDGHLIAGSVRDAGLLVCEPG